RRCWSRRPERAFGTPLFRTSRPTEARAPGRTPERTRRGAGTSSSSLSPSVIGHAPTRRPAYTDRAPGGRRSGPRAAHLTLLLSSSDLAVQRRERGPDGGAIGSGLVLVVINTATSAGGPD